MAMNTFMKFHACRPNSFWVTSDTKFRDGRTDARTNGQRQIYMHPDFCGGGIKISSISASMAEKSAENESYLIVYWKGRNSVNFLNCMFILKLDLLICRSSLRMYIPKISLISAYMAKKRAENESGRMYVRTYGRTSAMLNASHFVGA